MPGEPLGLYEGVCVCAVLGRAGIEHPGRGQYCQGPVGWMGSIFGGRSWCRDPKKVDRNRVNERVCVDSVGAGSVDAEWVIQTVGAVFTLTVAAWNQADDTGAVCGCGRGAGVEVQARGRMDSWV